MRDALPEFQAAMRARGLEPPAEIIPGKLHRFSPSGKRGDGAAWCKLFADGRGGVFGNWREGYSETWQANGDRPYSQAEREAFMRQIEAEKQERRVVEAKQRADTASRAEKIWGEATPAPEDHPYLLRKGIKPNGARIHNGRLVLALRDSGGALCSLQTIDSAGTKLFLSGPKSPGCYFSIGQPSDFLCIAEGFATAASIHEATGHAVAVAFNAGNLLPAAMALRSKYLDVCLILCADDDAATRGNPGITKATAAASEVGTLLAVPDFGEDRPEGASDFNDLATARGLDAVRACIANAKPVEAPQASQAGESATHPSRREAEAQDGDDWPELMPLVAETQAQPYPLDSLPGAIGEAVREVVGFVQCPDALAACSALSAASLAVQGLVDVRRTEGLTGPSSLYLLAIAESGERKTTCDGHFLSAIRDWEAERSEAMKPDIAKHAASMRAWEARRKGLLSKIEELSKANKPSDEQERELGELEGDKPVPPRVPRVVFGDATPEALAWKLATGWPSAGVLSSEAGIVFGGHGMKSDSVMRNLSLLNVLWEGGSQPVDRKQSESFILRGARLTMGLAVQPDTVRAFLESTKGLARGSGFAARFLIAWPESTQGSRLYREAPANWPRLSAFHRRVAELLYKPLTLSETGELAPLMLELSQAAKAAWIAFHNEVEAELRPGGDMESAKDVASKAADNAARLAAIFHVFEHGPYGAIGEDHLRAGASIAAWHLYEARRFLGTLALPRAAINAARLEAWLLRRCREAKADSVSTRDVRQFGPGALRDAKAFDEAIAELAEAGRARRIKEGRKVRVYLNPALLAGGTHGA